MKFKLIISMAMIIGCANQGKVIFKKSLSKENSSKHSEYRLQCGLASKEYVGNLPSKFVKVACFDDKRKDFGEMGHDVLHIVTVAAFYEERMVNRISAMNLLEKYNCKTKTECREFHQLLDWGIKSGHPQKYNKSLAKRANILRNKVSKKLSSFN
jgi:hypothetical protein